MTYVATLRMTNDDMSCFVVTYVITNRETAGQREVMGYDGRGVARCCFLDTRHDRGRLLCFKHGSRGCCHKHLS